MGRVYEKWHICKCLVFHAENLVKVYTQKNSGYTKSRRKIRQQKIPKINSKFLHIEVLSREAWASKDTRFLTLSPYQERLLYMQICIPPCFRLSFPAAPLCQAHAPKCNLRRPSATDAVLSGHSAVCQRPIL